MAVARLSIGGRSYDLACRAGEEAHFEALALRVDAKAREAQAALGGVNELRQLLLAALLLADDLEQGAAAATPPPPPAAPPPGPDLADALAALATRVEALAESLEKDAATP